MGIFGKGRRFTARHFAARLAAALLALTAVALAPAWARSSDADIAISYDPNQAVEQAKHAFERALATGDTAGQKRAMRLELWAEILRWRFPGPVAARAEKLAQQFNDEELLCESLIGKAVVELMAWRRDPALKLLDQAEAMAERGHWPALTARIQLLQGEAYLGKGMVAEAILRLPKAYRYFASQQDTIWMAESLAGTADVYMSSKTEPDRARATEYFHQAMALLDPKVHRLQTMRLQWDLGMVERANGKMGDARTHFQRALAMATELQLTVAVGDLRYRLAALERLEGHFEASLVQLAEAEKLFDKFERPERKAMIYVTRAQALAGLKRKKDAMEALAHAESMGKTFDSWTWNASYYDAATNVYSQLGEYEAAFKALTALRAADARVAEIANNKLAAELKIKFDMKFQEQENALLRAQQQEADARRMALFFALGLCVALLSGGAVYLFYQMRLKHRFHVLAMRDELTSLPNRRNILEVARMQFDARASKSQPLCVAILDIDHFKSINDSFGHDVGDSALVVFVETCRGQLRANDQIGRFGGEEFLLVLPDTDAGQIGIVFERIRESLRNVQIPGAPPDFRLTFSMGVSESRRIDSIEDMIKRADLALYRAKQTGRNRYEVALPLESGIGSFSDQLANFETVNKASQAAEAKVNFVDRGGAPHRVQHG